MRWSLAFGEYEDAVYYSVRTSDRRMNAGRLMRDVIEEKGGSAGGHGTMAGARLPMKGRSSAARKRDRKSVVEGKSVDLGGRRIIKKKKDEVAQWDCCKGVGRRQEGEEWVECDLE